MWTEYLKPEELKKLEKAKSKRDKMAEEYNETRKLLKSRADSRIRQERKLNDAN